MRQVVETIKERVSLADYRQRAYIEWQTKVLASFQSASAQSQKAGEAVMKAAEKISLTSPNSRHDAVAKAAPSLDHLPGEDGAPPKVAPGAGAELKNGSYERFVGTIGSRLARPK